MNPPRSLRLCVGPRRLHGRGRGCSDCLSAAGASGLEFYWEVGKVLGGEVRAELRRAPGVALPHAARVGGRGHLGRFACRLASMGQPEGQVGILAPPRRWQRLCRA